MLVRGSLRVSLIIAGTILSVYKCIQAYSVYLKGILKIVYNKHNAELQWTAE